MVHKSAFNQNFNKYLLKNNKLLLTFDYANDIIVIKEIMVMGNMIKRNHGNGKYDKKNHGDGKCDKKKSWQQEM